MKCYADIKSLAAERFTDAECLFANGRYDAAYYMAGYTVELLIKSKVCKNLGIEDFFDFANRNKFKNNDTITRPFKAHDLEQLLILSGIYTDFQEQLIKNKDFKIAWSIIEVWSENCRYLTGKKENDAKDLLTSIKQFELWILKYL
jgi:hypothetical protein